MPPALCSHPGTPAPLCPAWCPCSGYGGCLGSLPPWEGAGQRGHIPVNLGTLWDTGLAVVGTSAVGLRMKGQLEPPQSRCASGGKKSCWVHLSWWVPVRGSCWREVSSYQQSSLPRGDLVTHGDLVIRGRHSPRRHHYPWETSSSKATSLPMGDLIPGDLVIHGRTLPRRPRYPWETSQETSLPTGDLFVQG